MREPKLLILKRAPGSAWLLISEMGVVLTGPHRWGNQEQALVNARAFASTWTGVHVVTEEEYGMVKTSRVSQPV